MNIKYVHYTDRAKQPLRQLKGQSPSTLLCKYTLNSNVKETVQMIYLT